MDQASRLTRDDRGMSIIRGWPGGRVAGWPGGRVAGPPVDRSGRSVPRGVAAQ